MLKKLLLAFDILDEDNVLEELLLEIDEAEDTVELVEIIELVMLELEIEDNVVFVHLMLCQFPVWSLYSYWEHGFVLVILTLWTYAVKGALVKSVYPPAQFAVPQLVSGSPASQTPR